MATLNVTLPEALKIFVDRQADGEQYGTDSDYVAALIRRDQERQTLGCY